MFLTIDVTFRSDVLLSIATTIALGLALWAWDTVWTAIVARHEERWGHVSVTTQTIVLSLAAAVVLVPGATVALIVGGRADLVGLHFLSLSAPYDIVVWCVLLALTPAAVVGKFVRYRGLFAARCDREGGPVVVRPLWARLVEKLVADVSNPGNYVDRS